MKVTLVRGRSSDSAVYRVAETLSRKGNQVTLMLWDKQGRWSRERIVQNQKDKGYIVKPFNLKAPEDTWTVYFYFPLWTIYQLIFLLRNDTDVIHACDLDTLWPGIIVKSLKKKKFCYTIYDFYANNLIARHFPVIVNNARRFIAWLELTGIGFTDVLFLVDDCRYEEVKKSRMNKHAVIYNSPPDISKIDETGSGVKKQFTIFYIGLIHKNRGIDLMIKAIEDLENIKLIIGGTGPDLRIFENLPAHLKNKIEYIGWVPTYEEVLEKTAKADILFRFNDPKVPKSKYESPNKLFEAMMCSKPIIVNSEIAASNIVLNENCGVAVRYGDVEAMRQAVIKLKNNPAYREELGKNGRAAYEKRYSWAIMENRLLNAYDSLSA